MYLPSRAFVALVVAGLAAGALAAEPAKPATTAPAAKPTTSQPGAPATAPPITATPVKPGSPATPLTVTPVQVKPGAGPAATPPVPSGPTGTLEIKETVFDAGSVDRGTEVKHAFELKNVGKGDLTVEAKPG